MRPVYIYGLVCPREKIVAVPADRDGHRCWTGAMRRGLPRKPQLVEKPLYAPSERSSRTQKPRHCSVLVLISKYLDAVWTTDWSYNDFFNRLAD